MSFLLVPKTSTNNDLSAVEYMKTDRVTLKEYIEMPRKLTSEVARRKTASLVGFAGNLFINGHFDFSLRNGQKFKRFTIMFTADDRRQTQVVSFS